MGREQHIPDFKRFCIGNYYEMKIKIQQFKNSLNTILDFVWSEDYKFYDVFSVNNFSSIKSWVADLG